MGEPAAAGDFKQMGEPAAACDFKQISEPAAAGDFKQMGVFDNSSRFNIYLMKITEKKIRTCSKVLRVGVCSWGPHVVGP